MIYSDKQLGVSMRELTKLKDALSAVQGQAFDHDWMSELEANALGSQISELEADILQYKMLKSGDLPVAKSTSLENLSSLLVQARIAAGMTQSDLARALGARPQQIQRYEATNYMGASLSTLSKVANTLGVRISGEFRRAPFEEATLFSWNNVRDIEWDQFPIKEIAKRGWFDLPRGADALDKFREYLLEVVGPQSQVALHRKKVRGKTRPNEYALLAWQIRVFEQARQTIALSHDRVEEFRFEDQWLPELVSLTRRSDGPKRARKLLQRKGILLVIEEHLSGTYLDGAAMLLDDWCPVIGMTLRYDRLDNFWFVLFHELGHVYLHLMNGLLYDFFDEEDSSVGDQMELEADKFALDRLISDELWDQCLSRFALSEESVHLDAEKLGVHPSIIAGRIRKEQDNYSILTGLVGQDAVKKQFVGGEYEFE